MVGNSSVLSVSMRDNPLMQHYAGVYAMSMGVMLLLKFLRGIIFVKVNSLGICVYFIHLFVHFIFHFFFLSSHCLFDPLGHFAGIFQTTRGAFPQDPPQPYEIL